MNEMKLIEMYLDDLSFARTRLKQYQDALDKLRAFNGSMPETVGKLTVLVTGIEESIVRLEQKLSQYSPELIQQVKNNEHYFTL